VPTDDAIRPESFGWTKQEAAAYARCSVSTIQRAIRNGRLRAGGTVGLVRIRPEWVDEWLEQRNGGSAR
jgi:excisionase family DNA binding protein